MNIHIEGKTLSLRIWWGDTWDIRKGFTRKTEDQLNSLRIGKLVIAFGVEDYG